MLASAHPTVLNYSEVLTLLAPDALGSLICVTPDWSAGWCAPAGRAESDLVSQSPDLLDTTCGLPPLVGAITRTVCVQTPLPVKVEVNV